VFTNIRNNNNLKKRTFDVIFMLISAIVLVILIKHGLIEKYKGFALIPLLIAYQVGQYSERKFKD